MVRFLAFILISLLALSASVGGNGLRAKKIIKEIYENVLDYKCYKVKFICTARSNKANYFKQDTVSVTFKGNKYIIEHPEQKIISDGQHAWTFIGRQIVEELANENEFSGCNPQTFLSNWNDFYACVLPKENKKEIWVSFVVKKDLINKAKIVGISLILDPKTEEVKKVMLSNKNGETTTLSILAIEKHLTVDDKEFKP